MSDENLPALRQPSLFSDEEMDLLTIDQPETRKRYTAASLERRVALRDFILRCLAEGHGLLRIAQAAGVSHHLVSTLRDSRPDLVAIEKKQLSGQISRILKLSADRYEEALSRGTVPAAQIPVAFGIFADKKAQLDGDASVIVEHRHRLEPSADGFRARLRAAVDSEATGNTQIPQQKGTVLDAELVPDTAGPRSEGDGLGTAVLCPGPATPVRTDGGPGGGDAQAALPAATSMDPAGGAKEQKTDL